MNLIYLTNSYDWQWINCMYDEFGPQEKIRLPHSCVCLSTTFKNAEMLGLGRSEVAEFVKNPVVMHTHFADDDAYEQGYAYLKVCYYMRTQLKKV